MSDNTFSTPLSAIAGVVLDTETTGLDARTARVIQIGALRVAGGEVLAGERLETLLDPGVAIPPASSAVHGLTDADVAGAPRFAEMADALERFIGGALVIGHTIGFDLAVLEREASLAGRPWRAPRSLDVRVLAELALPTIAQYDLDRIASMLGVAIKGRHTAMGDAQATAEVFTALLPLLRQRGIRTLAEVDAASRLLADRYASSQRAFQPPPAASAPSPGSVLGRIDSFPYRHRVRDVMSSPVATCGADTPVREVLRQMMERRISSMLIANPDGVTGIVTERDLLRGIDKLGAVQLERPAGEIQSRPLMSVRQDLFLYRVIGRIERLRIRHLGVHDDDGRIVGMVTPRNLLRHRATTAIALGDEIDVAEGSAALARTWGKLAPMAASLLQEDVDPRTVAAVISSEVCALTRRAAELAEARLAAEGKGPPPVPYCVLVLGSAGRGESLLAADQDNAIVYASGTAGGAEDRWFEALGGVIADILDEVGVPYCKGGVMARNAQWRHSEADWRALVERWVRRQRPEDLLSVDIFFDSVVVHGDEAMGERLLAHAFALAGQARDFQVQLAMSARQWQAPFSLLGGLKTDGDGRLDAKKHGLFPIVAAARVAAIRAGHRDQGTAARLAAAGERRAAEDMARLIEAHRQLLGMVLAQQLIDGEQGRALSTKIDVRRLPPAEKRRLKDALGNVSIATDLAGEGML